MRIKVYMRVAKDGGRRYVHASKTPSNQPLANSAGALPTVAFALDLDIPDASFKQAEKVIAEIAVSEPEIAAEVRLVE